MLLQRPHTKLTPNTPSLGFLVIDDLIQISFPCLDHAFLYEPLSGKVFDALGVRDIKDVYDNYWTGDKHGGDGSECFLREMSPYELMGFEEVGGWMGFYDFHDTFQRSVNELAERILKEFGETIDLTH